MQYQVTCNKCGRKFMITSEGGEQMKCTCPYCAQQMMVNIPIVAEPVISSPQHPIPEKEATRSSHSVLTALIIILILLLAGGGAYLGLSKWRANQEETRQQLIAQRKAHTDSLMQIRAQEAAAEKAALQLEQVQKRVCRFLTSFYKKAVIPYGDPSFYEQYLTPYCKKMLYNGNELDADADKWSIWWGMFGMMNQAPNEEELIRNLAVTPVSDNWYKVRLTQQGQTEFRQVKVQINHGMVLIDDVR